MAEYQVLKWEGHWYLCVGKLASYSVSTSRQYEAINKASPVGKKKITESQKEIVKYKLPKVEAVHQ